MRGGYDAVIMCRFGNGLQGFFEPSAQLPAGDNPSDAGTRRVATRTTFGGTVKNPLDSLWGTVIAGVVLTAVLYAIARIAMGG